MFSFSAEKTKAVPFFGPGLESTYVGSFAELSSVGVRAKVMIMDLGLGFRAQGQGKWSGEIIILRFKFFLTPFLKAASFRVGVKVEGSGLQSLG